MFQQLLLTHNGMRKMSSLFQNSNDTPILRLTLMTIKINNCFYLIDSRTSNRKSMNWESFIAEAFKEME